MIKTFSKSLFTLAKPRFKLTLQKFPVYTLNSHWFSTFNPNLKEIEDLKQQFGGNNPTAAQNLHARGIAFLNKGEYATAVNYLEECVKMIKKIEKVDPPGIENLYNDLAHSHYELRNLKKAIEYYEKAIEAAKKVQRTSPHLVFWLSRLGVSYIQTSQENKAIETMEECVKLAGELYGPEHIKTSDILQNLGTAYLIVGRMNEAQKAFEESFDALKKHLGTMKDGPETAMERAVILNKGGQHLASSQKHDEAYDWFQQCLESLTKSGQKNDTLLAGTLGFIGSTAIQLGKYDEALEFLKRSIDLNVSLSGEDNVSLLPLRKEYGDLLMRKGELEEALSNYEKSIRILRDNMSDINPAFENQVLLAMGNCHFGLKRYQEAVEKFQESIKLLEKAGVPSANLGYISASISLSIAKETLGEREEAKLYAIKALKLAEELGIPDSPELQIIKAQAAKFDENNNK